MKKIKAFFTDKFQSPEFWLGWSVAWAIYDIAAGVHFVLQPGWVNFIGAMILFTFGIWATVTAVRWARYLMALEAERVGKAVLESLVNAMNELQKYNEEHVFERKEESK